MPDVLNAALENDMLGVGETTRVIADVDDSLVSELTYQSDDPDVATVENGVVTAVGAGDCVITVSLDDLTAQCSLSVYALPDSFEVALPVSEMEVGDEARIQITFPADTYGKAVYTSLKGKVTIDADGKVTAVEKGVDNIAVTVGNVTNFVTVTVYDEPDYFELALEESRLGVGYQTRAIVTYPEYTRTEFRYSSSNPDVATVDADGVVTAVGEGQCKIAATSTGGASRSVDLEVYLPSAELNARSLDMGVGDSYVLTFSMTDGSAAPANAQFVSSDPTVVSVDVDTDGLIHAERKGEATVSLVIGGETVATCSVTVKAAPTRIVVLDDAPIAVGRGEIRQDSIRYALYAGDVQTAGSVTFSSSNDSVVQVNGEGQLYGRSAGSATITLTAYNGVRTSVNVVVRSAPSSISITIRNATMAVGQVGGIGYTLPSNTASSVTYTSSNTDVATVDQDGNVTAVGVGSCAIRVSTFNGVYQDCAITVNKAPENVYLSVSANELGTGMTATSEASVDTTSILSFGYRYWTDRPDILEVSEETGEITALEVGTANVFVETYNGVTTHEENGARVVTSQEIRVLEAPESVGFTTDVMRVVTGHVFKLPIEMTGVDGSSAMTQLTVTSDNTSVLSVNNDGEAYGHKSGWATVTVTTSNGLSAQLTVGVHAKNTRVEIAPASLTVGEGMTEKTEAHVYYANGAYLTPNEVDMAGVGEFTIGNPSIAPSIATVDAYGNVTGVSKGETTLTFRRYDNDATASIRVTVVSKPTEIHLSEEEIELGEGMTHQLSATFGANEKGAVTYESDNSGIAKVDANGVVTAVSEGTATITASAESQSGSLVTAECVVHVLEAPESVGFTTDVMRVVTGHVFKLPIEMTGVDGSSAMTQLTVTSDNTSVLSVNNDGEAYGHKSGWATVTVTTSNGLSAQLTVGVHAKNTRVEIAPASLTVGEGMTEKTEAHVYYANGAYLTPNEVDMAGVGEFTIGNPSIATVDAYGNVTGVSKGETTLTFRRYDNDATASIRVTVVSKPTEIHLSEEEIELGEGMTHQLSATFGANEKGTGTYESDNSGIAKVDANGVVTAVSEGTATITASAESQSGSLVTAECVVHVLEAPESVGFTTDVMRVVTGHVFKLPIEMTGVDGSSAMTQLTVTSDNTSVLSVNNDGEAYGHKSGWATVTVTTSNGLSAQL